MKITRKPIFLIGLLVSTLYLQVAKAEVIVLTHPDVKAEELSATTLGRIFAMQVRTWPDGSPIKVFTFSPSSSLFKEFAADKARIQPHQLDRLWKRLMFTGTGRVPVIVNSRDEMVKSIKSTPGAIGYLDLPQDFMGLKVVEVKRNEN